MPTKIGPGLISSALPVNLLDNGGFEIWQRGVSFGGYASAQTNVPVADRWLFSQNAANYQNTVVSKSASGNTGNCLQINVSGTMNTASVFVKQVVENPTFYRGKYLSLSVRVKTTMANRVQLDLSDSSTEIYSANHSGSGNWETLTCSKLIAANATYINIYAGMVAPSQFLAGDIFIDDAMLIVSDKPVDFIPEVAALDMLRCLRHYEKIEHFFSSPILHRTTTSSQYCYDIVPMTPKKSTPTLTVSGLYITTWPRPTQGLGNVEYTDDTANWNATAFGVSTITNMVYCNYTRPSLQTTRDFANPYSVITLEVT